VQNRSARILAFLLFSVAISFTRSLLAKELKVFNFASNNATTSGEILLILEEVVKANPEKYKILSIKEAVGYKKQSAYLFPNDPDEVIAPFTNERVNDVQSLENKVKHLEKHPHKNEVFESARTLMIVPGEAPPEFIESIRAKKNTLSKLNTNRRFWSDLKNYPVNSYFSENEQIEKVDLNHKDWAVDKGWKLALYRDYVVQAKDSTFTVRIIPKYFAGIDRIFGTARNEGDAGSVFISTGNLLGDDNLRYRKFADFFNDFKFAFVVANTLEIENYGNDLQSDPKQMSDPRITAIQKDRVISNNLCEEADVVEIKEGKEVKSTNCEKKIFKPFVSLETEGYKVAIVGLTSPEAQSELDRMASAMPQLKKLRIQKPVMEELSDLLFKLHQTHDFVILATNMTPTYIGENLHDLTGADFLVFKDNRKFVWDETVEAHFKNYADRFPFHFLQELDVSSTYAHALKISRQKNDVVIKTHRIVYNQSKNSGPDFNDSYPKNFIENFFKNEYVLPDQKKILKDELVADQNEFANLSAQVLKSGFNAEIGISNIQYQNNTQVGPQEIRGVRTWMRQDDSVEIAYLKGAEIKRLYQQNTDFKDNDKLVFFGLSPDFKINGLSINDNELYRVVMPKSVSQGKLYSINAAYRADKFVKVAEGKYEDSIDGKVINYADFIIDDLRNKWKIYEDSAGNPEKTEDIHKNYAKLYKGEATEAATGYWTHTLDNLSLEYSQLTTSDASDFSNVTDSRLKTVDQRFFAAALNYKASYNKFPFVNELGLSARYSKLQVLPSNAPSVLTILDDQLRGYANAALPIFSFDNYHWLAKEMGPYSEISYDTEFEAEPGGSLQRNLTGFLGLKFFNGEIVKTASVFVLVNKYLTESNPHSALGAGFKFEASKRFINDLAEYKVVSDYRYFFEDDAADADIRNRFVLDQSFNLNITNKISFGPYFRYLTLTRKSVEASVNQNVIGVNLTYSDFWKPKYRTP
jgi:hypothetical protein